MSRHGALRSANRTPSCAAALRRNRKHFNFCAMLTICHLFCLKLLLQLCLWRSLLKKPEIWFLDSFQDASRILLVLYLSLPLIGSGSGMGGAIGPEFLLSGATRRPPRLSCHGSAPTIVWREGLPVPAWFFSCYLREHKHGRAEVSVRRRGCAAYRRQTPPASVSF